MSKWKALKAQPEATVDGFKWLVEDRGFSEACEGCGKTARSLTYILVPNGWKARGLDNDSLFSVPYTGDSVCSFDCFKPTRGYDAMVANAKAKTTARAPMCRGCVAPFSGSRHTCGAVDRNQI